MKTSLLMAAGAGIDIVAACLLWAAGFHAIGFFMAAVALAIGAFAFVQWRRGQ